VRNGGGIDVVRTRIVRNVARRRQGRMRSAWRLIVEVCMAFLGHRWEDMLL
jgi:hypothetical protein